MNFSGSKVTTNSISFVNYLVRGFWVLASPLLCFFFIAYRGLCHFKNVRQTNIYKSPKMGVWRGIFNSFSFFSVGFSTRFQIHLMNYFFGRNVLGLIDASNENLLSKDSALFYSCARKQCRTFSNHKKFKSFASANIKLM